MKTCYNSELKKIDSTDGTTFKTEKILYCFDCNSRYDLKGDELK